jgi:hypothetical protein
MIHSGMDVAGGSGMDVAGGSGMDIRRSAPLRSRSRLLVVIGLFATLACSSSGTSASGKPDTGGTPGRDSGGPLPYLTLQVDPENLRTGLDGTTVKPSVLASPSFGYPGVTDGGQFAVDFELQADPTSATVPSAGKFDSPGQGGGVAYRLTPTSSLTAGWYTLLLTGPPGSRVSGFRLEGPAGPSLRKDGKYETHFRVGSEPLLISVAACASKGDGLLPKLIVWFSEAVLVPDPPPVQVTANGAATSCTVYDPPSPNRPNGVGMSCDPAMPADADLIVSIAEGFTSAASGLPLRDVDGNTQITVQIPPANPGDTCRTWRETRVPAN